MWTVPVASAVPDEAIAELLDLAKAQLRVTTADEDELISHFVRTAIGHVERITGTYFVDREITLLATAWSDLARLPVAPVQEVSEIHFVPSGAEDEELADAGGYRARLIGLEPSIRPAPGHRWPAQAPGSDIRIVLVAGYGPDRPAELWQAALLMIGQWFRNRSATNIGNLVTQLPNGVDALLCNHRIHLAG